MVDSLFQGILNLLSRFMSDEFFAIDFARASAFSLSVKTTVPPSNFNAGTLKLGWVLVIPFTDLHISASLECEFNELQ